MSSREVKNAGGSWRVGLVPETPESVLEAIDVDAQAFAEVYVTPVWIEPASVTTTTLRALSVYGGILTDQGGRGQRQLGGPGLWSWLGDEEGKGPRGQGGAATLKTAATWFSDLCSGTPVGVGTIFVFGSLTWSAPATKTRRECIEYVADQFAVDPLTIDHRTRELTTDVPNDPDNNGAVVFTPWWDGREVGGTNLLRAAMTLDRTAGRFATEAIVSDGTAFPGSANLTPIPFDDPAGNDVERSMVVNDGDLVSAQFATAAGGIITDRGHLDRIVTLETDEYDPASICKPGTLVSAFDPVEGVYDLDNAATTIRGMSCHLETFYVESIEWPWRRGMGVFVILSTGLVVDLSRWVQWEDGPARLSLGRPSHARLIRPASLRGFRRLS